MLTAHWGCFSTVIVPQIGLRTMTTAFNTYKYNFFYDAKCICQLQILGRSTRD